MMYCLLLGGANSRKLAYNNGLAHVYDVQSETTSSFECKVPDQTDIVTSVALSPDGQYLAAANRDIGVCLWNLEAEELIGRLYTQIQEGAEKYDIDIQATDLAWSPDGSRLALISPYPPIQIASEKREWFIEVWSVLDGEQLASIEGITPPTDIAWSPDGNYLAVGHSDGIIHIWQRE